VSHFHSNIPTSKVRVPGFKTLPAMVGTTDIVFFEAPIVVTGFDTTVFISQTKVPVSKTKLSASDSIIRATNTKVSVDETIVFANEKIFFVTATMVFASEKIFCVIKKIFSKAEKIFFITITMVEGDIYPIDYYKVRVTSNFYHGICLRKDLFNDVKDLVGN
jgi:hypothetical protein